MQASAGIAESDGSGVTIVELLRRADVAMYAAKAVGKRLEFYDASLDEADHARLETVRELRVALSEGQFVLHYQPKIAIDTGETLGAEALVRWQPSDPRAALPRCVSGHPRAERVDRPAHGDRPGIGGRPARQMARGRPPDQRGSQPLGVRPAQ